MVAKQVPEPVVKAWAVARRKDTKAQKRRVEVEVAVLQVVNAIMFKLGLVNGWEPDESTKLLF
jgi:hypothetical protein